MAACFDHLRCCRTQFEYGLFVPTAMIFPSWKRSPLPMAARCLPVKTLPRAIIVSAIGIGPETYVAVRNNAGPQ